MCTIRGTILQTISKKRSFTCIDAKSYHSLLCYARVLTSKFTNTKRIIRVDLRLLRLILPEKVCKYSTVSFGDFTIIKQSSRSLWHCK